MDKLTPIAYWEMVRDEAWKRAWSGANMKYIIPALVLTLSGVSCYGLFALANVVPYPVFKDNVVATFMIQSGQVFIPIAVLIFLALRGMSSIPPELHNKQVDQINQCNDDIRELENKLAGSRVQPLRIECFNYKETNRLIGVSICNPNLQTVTNLKVKLVDLSLVENGQIKPQVKDANFHELLKGKFTEQNAILPNETVVVWIADVDPDETLTFYLEREIKVSNPFPMLAAFFQSPAADYEIKLTIVGYIDNHRIDQPFKAAIHRELGRKEIVPSNGDKPARIQETPTSLHIEEISNDQETDQKASTAQEK